MRGSQLVQGSHGPAAGLLAQWLAERGQRLVSANVGSLGGLVAPCGAAKRTWRARICWMKTARDYNLAALRQWLLHEPLRLVTFAHR